MSKDINNYYVLRKKAYKELTDLFYRELEAKKCVNTNFLVHIITLKYGLSRKFVLESLSVLAGLNGLAETEGSFVQESDEEVN